MTSGKMYWKGGKEKIPEKIISLAKINLLNVKNFTTLESIEVEINLSDAVSEGLKDGDIVEIKFDSIKPDTLSVFKIKPTLGIISNHFLFIMENKEDFGLKNEKSSKIK